MIKEELGEITTYLVEELCKQGDKACRAIL